MEDHKSKTVNHNELKFSREQGFFDKNLTIRLMIGLLFTVSLFVILHFQELRVETLELNSIAPSYIVSQVDFDFYDEEAALILRQEAVRDVGKIYQISEKEIRQRRMEFENFLLYNQEWPKPSTERGFDEFYMGGDAMEKTMLRIRFSDPWTIQKMKAANLPTDDYEIFTPGVLSEKVYLPSHIWESIANKAFPKDKFSEPAIEFMVEYFKNFGWMIEEDIPAQRMLRKKIQASVPDKMTHVSAGSRILDQGEKVTARHFAMLQAMKAALSDQRNLMHPATLVGSGLLAVLFTVICYFYFDRNYPEILFSNRKLFLLVTITLLTFGLAKVTEFFLISSKNNLIDIVHYPIFVAFAAILLCSLMNTGIASFASGFLTLVLTFSLAFENQGFMMTNLAAAFIAILTAHNLRRRKEVFVVCLKAWAGCVIVILALHLSKNMPLAGAFIVDIISSSIFMLLTAVLVVGLLPLLESSFHVMTDVTLTEYMDPNTDLLRRLTLEAPGTYQHSVVVGNLAETAALAIGANGLFCRVATLYHDIGKMANPQFFTENQHGGVNIHQLLTPEESAEVIIAHVRDGVAMGRKAGLPEQIIDIIKEHHGTTLVYYFYRKQLEKVNGDKMLVDKKKFTYSGPKPRSKESAIIMIADTLEAASRSLDKTNEADLLALANNIIREKAEDGQFDESLLTLEELSIVKMTLVKTLVAFAHTRIKYPNREIAPHEFFEAQSR